MMTALHALLSDYQDRSILIAPLNWGLGHATRCLPIIRILQQNNKVVIASDGVALAWLSQELPEVECYTLPSYNIRYHRKYMWLSMVSQLNHIHRAIRREAAKTREIVDDQNIDLIISDHRLGVRMPEITSIIIAHQLLIPFKISWISQMITYAQSRYIGQFHECWVPDYEEPDRLSGQLSSTPLDITKRYIGPLSRLQHSQSPDTYKYDVAVILSGPEPTRTQLERRLQSIFKTLDKIKIIMVRGTEEQNPIDLIDMSNQMEIMDLVDSRMMMQILEQSAIVICRSGYSSIMDLDRMQKRAVMIPTSGHPEQEYLAQWLSKENQYFILKESNLSVSSLEKALNSLRNPSK